MGDDPPSTGELLLVGGALAVAGLAWFLFGRGSGGCAAGQFGVALQVSGAGALCATPGPICAPQSLCGSAGELATFTAVAASGHSFSHFEGPGGASTTQNPFSQHLTGSGYVKAVFV